MDNLNLNWITEGHIDFEYKKYVLLSYLQSAENHFKAQKIFPFLHDLISHKQNLISIRDTKRSIENNLPKEISKLDFENHKIHYQFIGNDDVYIEEILNIIDYALPRITDQIIVAKHLYDEVDHHIAIDTVGILPVYSNEGYLLFKTASYSSTDVYFYELSIFENNHERYRGLKTTFFQSYPRTIYNYDEAIKSDLIRKNRMMPNPATFVLHCSHDYPFPETLFPVAKRRFVRFLSGYTA